MRHRNLAALAVLASALGCAAAGRPPGAPKVALSAPGDEPGTREFVLDDVRFVGPDWAPRIVHETLVVEEPGPCRERRFYGLLPLYKRYGWEPETSCAAIMFWRRDDAHVDEEHCEALLERGDQRGSWRYASSWSMTREPLGGRPARHYVYEVRLGTETIRGHEYHVCTGTSWTVLAMHTLAPQGEELERMRARVVASFRWDAPIPGASSSAPASR